MNTFWLITIIVLVGERMAKLFLIRHFFGQIAIAPHTASPQTVSILQPILSGDPTLWQCLRENLKHHSQCPREFVWLVDDNDQAALDGCRQLITEHPDIDIKLHVMAPPPDGVNPKMFKLIAGIEIARGELIAVLDDDTVLPDAAFEQCLPYLASPQVGLVFGLPYYVSFANLWSALVACFVNSNSLL
ncbi:MAG: glycosyltransferase, partial [Acidobacteria bacterium]|nr:glycosyltransferase [Acidobacteriota bacterium]